MEQEGREFQDRVFNINTLEEKSQIELLASLRRMHLKAERLCRKHLLKARHGRAGGKVEDEAVSQ